LQYQIRNQRSHADQRDQHAQSRAVVFACEEVRLRDQPLGFRKAPDGRQHPVRQDIGQRPVSENVIDRRTLAVGEPAAAEKGEGGVDLTRHQQEHERGAETAAADGPLFETHVVTALGAQSEIQRECREEGDDNESAAHDRASSVSTAV
jgi:hypothetical protein